jgi:hypothetical protein
LYFSETNSLNKMKDGSITLRGGWTGLRLPETKGPVTLNGEAAKSTTQEGALLFGRPPTVVAKPIAEEPLPEVPLTVKTTPAVARVAARDRRTVTFTLNTLQSGYRVSCNSTCRWWLSNRKVDLWTNRAGIISNSRRDDLQHNPGRHTVPYRISYRVGAGKEISTVALPLTVMTGATVG